MADLEVYQVAVTDKIRNLEKELSEELKELKNEIEENEMVHGIPQKTVSSVLLPKDAEHFRRERKLVIDRAMEVCQVKPLTIQAEVMREEMENCERLEYTPDSLPLLLHQYFCDRIQQLVQAKHMHMLRWTRFCEHTSTIEALYPLYQQRLVQIMSEYHDCLERAHRLAVAREAYLAGSTQQAIHAVKLDDMMIYLRWLVCHLHSVKRVNQFLRILQWFPKTHKFDIVPEDPESQELERPSSASRLGGRYDDAMSIFSRSKSPSRPGSAASRGSLRSNVTPIPPPQPPPLNPVLLSTNPLSASSFANSAAAAGGGIASDEMTLNLPLHVNDFERLRPQLTFLVNLYGIQSDVETIVSTADEMELFAAVYKKFRHLFQRQEHLRTYKTYDKLELGMENWGADQSGHALKQESNWVPFIKIKPEVDPFQEKRMTQLRQKNKVDELLRVMSRFLEISDPDRVQDAFRDHAMAVREPPTVQAVSVTTNKTNYHTGAVWKKIYTNPELYSEATENDAGLMEFDEKEADNVNFDRPRSPTRRRKDSYDYANTVRMFGLDDGDQESTDPASMQGAYLSFLALRHLRIRDLQRSCLSILNYFRSVERTLTINDGGLSLESGKLKRGSSQNHRKGVSDSGNVGIGGGLGSHAYMHNTPRDFKISESEFMEFSEIENHDDFYTLDEGRVHVQDQRGYYIIYDTALEDMKKLQHDMLLVATDYIEKDRELRTATGIMRSESARRRQTVSAGGFDIPSYAHREVDRFAILLDLWSNEAAYLECKKNLLDCYFEAYQHVFDRDEKRNLAQVITNIMNKRPRFDFGADYFVKTYRMECITLRLQTTLVQSVLDNQIEEQREYLQKVCRDGDSEYGLPFKVIPKQPISVNMSRSALRNVYMMEFHPSLALASRIPVALKHSYWELYHIHKPETVTDMIVLEKKLLESAVKEWDKMEPMGASYSVAVQKDLFSDVFVEDPLFVCEIGQTLVNQAEEKSEGKPTKERHLARINAVSRLMEAYTIRFRLMDAACEAEVLSKEYRKQSLELGFDEYHMFLRFVQFEFATHKNTAGNPPPVLITAIQEDESAYDIDRFIPNNIYLGIHELDEGHVGRFSFRSRDGVLQIMRGQGLENLQVILMAQVVHKNALMSAVVQADACLPVKQNTQDIKSGMFGAATIEDAKSEKSSLTATTAISGVPSQGTTLTSKLTNLQKTKGRSPEAFVSLQLEKAPSRDLMLNEFLSKKQTMGTVLKNPEELEKLKRRLIGDFCRRFWHRISQYSLRGQIIAYYNSILGLLQDFPNICNTYFMKGEYNEKKAPQDDTLEHVGDTLPSTIRKRPRRVLSEDGKHVLNIWFIPHHGEVLVMFKKLPDEECSFALGQMLRIVSALHDILQYLCAHAKLGSSHARLGSRKMEFVSADWGGTEGIGAELREIQKQIDNLEHQTSPDQVATFLSLRREVMYLEFDTSVRHSMRDTFLSTGNKQAYQAITKNMHFALPFLSNMQEPSVFSMYLNVPEPLEARDFQAKELYPWRSFIGCNGPFPVNFWQWQQIEYNLQLCLAGLRDVDRHVANGEILGVSLLMEDVLQSGFSDMSSLGLEDDEEDTNNLSVSKRGTPKPSRPGTSKSAMSVASATSTQTGASWQRSGLTVLSRFVGKRRAEKKQLSRTAQPVESYKLLKMFLVLWKQLEVYKYDWGCRKLGLEGIDTPVKYKDMCKYYKAEMLFPVLQSVARRYGQGELYDGMVLDSAPLVAPTGASDFEIKIRQLIKLCEGLEEHMIHEVQRKLAKELNLVLTERSREEGALPTDLWKRPVMKEGFTLNKPHIAEDFSSQLFTDFTETDGAYTFSKNHFNACMLQLQSSVMEREKHNFESYTMYYETLLRQHHQLLYQKEQEAKQVRDQLKAAENDIQVEVQCQLADRSNDLILEITALRAKIAEMRQQAMDMEKDLRERIRDDYDSLIQNLFAVCYDLKTKFDEFRENLHDEVYEKINEVRREAIEQMGKLKEKSGGTSEEEVLTRGLLKANKLRDIQRENHELNGLMIKMRMLNFWKQTHTKDMLYKSLSEQKRAAERNYKECIGIKLQATEEVILLRQHLLAVRKAFQEISKECGESKKELDKQVREKEEKTHAEVQKARSQRQLEAARQANIEKLVEELEIKEHQLRRLTEDYEKNSKMQVLMEEKTKKDMTHYKKQLSHERNLKLDAFQRVDDLQSTVYDIESGLFSRAQTSVGYAPSMTTTFTQRTKSRVESQPKSARTLTSRGQGTMTASSSGIWPPPVIWPANRTLTPDITGRNNVVDEYGKKIARPKTVAGRLRSRIADQLVNELDPPDHHETIMKLREMQLNGSVK